MSKTDELISKLEELIIQYEEILKIFDFIPDPGSKSDRIKSEISQLKEQIKKEDKNNNEYVREWYAKKTNRKVDEFDDYDLHICNVIFGYVQDNFGKQK
jgi:hypothetical protein